MPRLLARGAIGAFALIAAGTALAAPRTFVSGVGSDANPCSRDLPCRSFTAALVQVDAGGEVVVLDTAGYGPFRISKAVSIIAPPGILAAISNSVLSDDNVPTAIYVRAGPTDKVVLRGMNVNIQAGNIFGVLVHSVGTLHIENSFFKGSNSDFAGGLWVDAQGPVKLFVKDSQFRTFGNGIVLRGINARIDAVVERTRIQDTYDGVTLANDVKAVMRETVSTGNQGVGFAAYNGDPSITVHASLILERCTASNNGGVGVLADPASINHGAITSTFVTISNCVVTNNGVGVEGTTFAGSWPAMLITRGNNTVRENGTNSIGTIVSDTGF
jgi:parallel beta helix pectate lyase-like protein